MAWNRPELLPSEYQAIEVVDVITKLPINPTGGWEDFKPSRKQELLTRIVLHHDGIAKARSQGISDMQFMVNIANSHIRSKKNRQGGDGGFPYHIYIRNGKVYLTNRWQAFTYGVASNNDYTIHISVGGDYANYDVLTDADRKALHLAILIAKSNMPNFKDIKGHREITPTSCPGYSVSQVISEVLALEHQIEIMKTPQNQGERAYEMANQILYLYNMFAHGKTATGKMASEGERKWALQQVLSLEPEMKRLGFMK